MVHIAGKSALALRGYMHHQTLGQGKLYLYGWHVRKLPQWLTRSFNVDLSTAKLFKENDKTEERLV